MPDTCYVNCTYNHKGKSVHFKDRCYPSAFRVNDTAFLRCRLKNNPKLILCR